MYEKIFIFFSVEKLKCRKWPAVNDPPKRSMDSEQASNNLLKSSGLLF